MNTTDQVTAFISADYEEGKPETFSGFVVSRVKGDESMDERTFQTWHEAGTHAQSFAGKIIYSSTVEEYQTECTESAKRRR